MLNTPATEHAPTHRRLHSELDSRRPATSNTRWGGVVAGALAALSVWLVLHLLGIGIGLTAIDRDGSSSLRAIGIGTGLWSAIAPIVALFVGGLVASRLAPSPSLVDRMLHGGLVWAIVTVIEIALVFFAVTAMARGIASTGKLAASAISSTVGSAMDSDVFGALGLDADDVLAPVNSRLRAENKPEVSPAELKSATHDALMSAAAAGTIDRDMLVQALARNTRMTQSDANEVAAAIETKWDAASRRMSELAARAKTAALEAADATGKALLWLSLALVLGLAAAVGGAALTGHRDRRQLTPIMSAGTDSMDGLR